MTIGKWAGIILLFYFGQVLKRNFTNVTEWYLVTQAKPLTVTVHRGFPIPVLLCLLILNLCFFISSQGILTFSSRTEFVKSFLLTHSQTKILSLLLFYFSVNLGQWRGSMKVTLILSVLNQFVSYICIFMILLFNFLIPIKESMHDRRQMFFLDSKISGIPCVS